MPLKAGSSPSTISSNIKELHTGKTYAHTAGKFGKERADKQAVAIAFSEARGRAFGGVAPMFGQAFNPTMPNGNQGAMPGANPTTMMNNIPQMQTMPQPPINGVAGGVPPTPMTMPPMGLNAGVPGPAGARPFAFGGGVNPAPKMFKGPIVSDVPGRTDKHLTHVSSGSFVIPADIVSGHGQGNTLAGMNTLQKMFKMGPHAANPSRIPGASSAIHKFSKGGKADQHVGKPVPVKLAGGEIVVPPENAHETMCRITGKKLTLDQAHAAMDQWVLNERKKLRKQLAALPGPSKD